MFRILHKRDRTSDSGKLGKLQLNPAARIAAEPSPVTCKHLSRSPTKLFLRLPKTILYEQLHDVLRSGAFDVSQIALPRSGAIRFCTIS